VIAKKNGNEQAAILKAYLRGVQRIWPDAWGDTREYMLCGSMGIELLLAVFGAAKTRCDLNRGRQYTPESFALMLEPIRDVHVQIPETEGEGIFLDWRRGSLAVFSNAPGKRFIRMQLLDLLRAADED
jgi:hypothetical protein